MEMQTITQINKARNVMQLLENSFKRANELRTFRANEEMHKKLTKKGNIKYTTEERMQLVVTEDAKIVTVLHSDNYKKPSENRQETGKRV